MPSLRNLRLTNRSIDQHLSHRKETCFPNLRYPKFETMVFSIDAPNLQIWDNAAFDSASGGEDSAGEKAWLPLQAIYVNLSQPPNLDPSKENKIAASTPIKPLGSAKSSKKAGIVVDGNLEAEIEEVEKEIRRLSMKLEALRIRKAERDLRTSTARRGRVVPAKFMEQKPSPCSMKMEESPASARLQRRGFSLGPMEIRGSISNSCFHKLEGIKEEQNPTKPQPFVTKIAEARQESQVNERKKKVADSAADSSIAGFRQRGRSLGPSEISAGARCRLQPSKLQEIKEKGGKTEKRQSLSVSPKSRKPSISSLSELRKGVATVGAKKPLKREDTMLGNLKPKALFQEGKNTASSKKPVKKARVRIVASRYSLAPARSEEPERKRRKWSLPEPSKEKIDDGTESNHSGAPATEEEEGDEQLLIASSPTSITRIATMLPRIRTLRDMAESPRDSGCAKRVAQLIGKKSHFSMEEGRNSQNQWNHQQPSDSC